MQTEKVENLKIFIDKQPKSTENEVAVRLLAQVGTLQNRIRHQITNVARLMINSKTFIDYNLNVMSQAVANNTYGSDLKVGQHQTRRVFNANV